MNGKEIYYLEFIKYKWIYYEIIMFYRVYGKIIVLIEGFVC